MNNGLLGKATANNQHYSKFKPSTKEAFDEQNKPKSIEKWSVGSYVVFLEDNLQRNNYKKGDVSEIKRRGDKTICFEPKINDITGMFSVADKLKWFATKIEAEAFAKTLQIEDFDLNKEVKQPLKQAVHCTTQEEWDFVLSKIKQYSLTTKHWSIYKTDTCFTLLK